MTAWSQTLAATPYSIGYIGVSFRATIAKAGLGTAMLEEPERQVPAADAATPIAAAAAELDPRTPPDERLSLVFAPGDDSYPLINYEYAVVSKTQPDACDGGGAARLPALGDLRRRRQRAEISEHGRLHPASRLHPRPERGTDRSRAIGSEGKATFCEQKVAKKLYSCWARGVVADDAHGPA